MPYSTSWNTVPLHKQRVAPVANKSPTLHFMEIKTHYCVRKAFQWTPSSTW